MSDTNQNPQPIIDLLLADINAVIPNFSSLVSSYRLLVGAAEELHRIPGVCPDVFERAVRRSDNAGTLIDILLELLCCKIAYSSAFLSITCAPIDLFRLIANCTDEPDTPCRTAESVVLLEALRRILGDYFGCCLPNQQVVCPPPPPSPPAPPAPPKQTPPAGNHVGSDLAEVVFTEEIAEGLTTEPTQQLLRPKIMSATKRTSQSEDNKPPLSRVRPKHLKDTYSKTATKEHHL